MSISILILTKNEAHDLPGCLASIKWSNDIVIYDSFSSDKTLDIARSAGTRVIQRSEQNQSLPYGGDEGFHRNWGIHEIAYKNQWLLVIDADERLSSKASLELRAIAENKGNHYVAYRIRRRDFFQGRHLCHVQTSSWYIRFFKPEFVHYERLINPVTVVNGQVGNLKYPLDHYPFSKGLSHWISRHNNYSDFEAQQIIKNRNNKETFNFYAAFFERDYNRRRFHQKELFYRMPGRPLIKFILLYIIKRGFMDGKPGFVYALLQTMYETMIILKVKELEQKISINSRGTV